jgi:hypothetical protein
LVLPPIHHQAASEYLEEIMFKKILNYLDGKKTYILGVFYLGLCGAETAGYIPPGKAVEFTKGALEGGMLLTIRLAMKKKEKVTD